ncbi:unnamed protein product, partial [Meganyctiphanes norvegica]
FQLSSSAMQMSNATCFVLLLALSACLTPAISQIHWNRGWGASGSNVGKRGGSADPMEIMDLLDSAGCSLAITQLSGVLEKLVQSSVRELVTCQLGHRSGDAEIAH